MFQPTPCLLMRLELPAGQVDAFLSAGPKDWWSVLPGDIEPEPVDDAPARAVLEHLAEGGWTVRVEGSRIEVRAPLDEIWDLDPYGARIALTFGVFVAAVERFGAEGYLHLFSAPAPLGDGIEYAHHRSHEGEVVDAGYHLDDDGIRRMDDQSAFLDMAERPGALTWPLDDDLPLRATER